MPPRASAPLLAVILLVAGVATALLLADPPRVTLVAMDGPADHVTLYPNGLAFVTSERTFESPGGELVVAFPLPSSARLDSVHVEGEGVEVLQIWASARGDASLRPGDALIVHTSDGKTFRGAYAGREGGAILLDAEAGLTRVREAEATAIEILGRAPSEAPAGTLDVSALVRAPAGEQAARVSYLAEGAGWTPSHALDAATGDLQFHATLTSFADWENVTLDLVSGDPHVVLRPRPPTPMPAPVAFESSLRMAAGGLTDETAPSTPLGELHRYRYERPLTLARGASARILVEEGTLDIVERRHEVDAVTGAFGFPSAPARLNVFERIEVENTLAEPLPPGVVLAYREGTWIGEDMLPPTPRGERANLTLALSEDVVARLTLVSAEPLGTRERMTYVLDVTDRKETPILLRATLQHPTFRTTLVEVAPPADETLGGRVTWTREIAPGETASFRISYETEHG